MGNSPTSRWLRLMAPLTRKNEDFSHLTITLSSSWVMINQLLTRRAFWITTLRAGRLSLRRGSTPPPTSTNPSLLLLLFQSTTIKSTPRIANAVTCLNLIRSHKLNVTHSNSHEKMLSGCLCYCFCLSVIVGLKLYSKWRAMKMKGFWVQCHHSSMCANNIKIRRRPKFRTLLKPNTPR